MRSAPYVKICGITCAEDAQLATQFGASAIGVNFFEGSRRSTSPGEALPWLQAFEGSLDRIAVVVDASEEFLGVLREAGCFEAVQFHGSESPEFCKRAGFPRWIKAVRVRGEQDLESVLAYETPEILLDSYMEGAHGGTGKRLDWDLARDFIEDNRDRRVLVAGGLSPVNVRDAVRLMRPWGVDVASGVEKTPRSKDIYLVREFIRQAHSAHRRKSQT